MSGSASFSAVWFDAATDGEAPYLAPGQFTTRHARALRNYLVHRPGALVPRGNIGGAIYSFPTGSLVDTTNGGTLLGLANADDTLIATYRAPAAAPRVDYWRAPINRPLDPTLLAQPSLGATAGRTVDLSTGITTNIATADPHSVFGPSVCRVDQALYSASFGGTATLVNGYYAPLNVIRKVAIGGAGVVLTNGPMFVQAVFEHYGRVWAAAARKPGDTDYDPSQVFYTIPGGTTALTDVTTDWQDPDTGELQRFAIGAANDGDFVVGFGRAAGHLLIFKRNSVWIMYGTSPANFTLRQLRANSGCVDLRSIAVCDEGTYFASQLGFELFDGQTFRLLSRPIDDIWQGLSLGGAGAPTVNHGFIRSSVAPNGYLHVALGTDGHLASSPDGTARAWLLYRPTGAWVDCQTAATSELGLGADGYFNRLLVTPSATVAVGASKWGRADFMTYGADGDNGLADMGMLPVELVWESRVDDLASARGLSGKWQTAKLHLATVDFHQHFTDDGEDGVAWGTLSAKDGWGASLLDEARDVAGYAPPGPVRARPVFEMKPESDRGDVILRLDSNIGDDEAVRHAGLSVYGMGIAYDQARERHVA